MHNKHLFLAALTLALVLLNGCSRIDRLLGEKEGQEFLSEDRKELSFPPNFNSWPDPKGNKSIEDGIAKSLLKEIDENLQKPNASQARSLIESKVN